VLMEEVIRARYSPTEWNIYGAQASDGDNWHHDSGRCRELLTDKILPLCRYFAYVQVAAEDQNLWTEYLQITASCRHFAMRKAVEASLTRLKTDHIDLYQSHDDDAETPLADSLGVFADLIKAGKVRAIGASNYTAPRLAEALDLSDKLGLPRYESLQPLYNLYDRAVFEGDLEPLCLKRGVGVINFYALAAGFLTGKYRSEADAAKSKRGESTTKKYLNARGLRILDALDVEARKHDATPGQVALAWQIARPAITAPIASATSIEQLDDLVKAAQLKLDAETIAALDAASTESSVEAKDA